MEYSVYDGSSRSSGSPSCWQFVQTFEKLNGRYQVQELRAVSIKKIEIEHLVATDAEYILPTPLNHTDTMVSIAWKP